MPDAVPGAPAVHRHQCRCVGAAVPAGRQRHCFISEEAGASKPSAAYFDYVFSHIDGITRDNCLLVGDSLSSDIRGANNAGIPCCWYNPRKTARPGDLRIDYEIRDLRQLYDLV